LWAGEWDEDPAGDEEILTRAYEEGRVLVTLDKDFGELAVVRRKPHTGIVRLVNFPARQQGVLALKILTHYAAELLSGAIVTVDSRKIRVRDIIREICAEKGLEVVKGNIRANHIHILISAPAYFSPAKIAQYLKGKSSYRLQREFPSLQKRYWGRHLWSRGYFCSTVGAVTEEQIQQYIANQLEEPGTFKVWDEAQGAPEGERKLESDASE
jgi:putative transposase